MGEQANGRDLAPRPTFLKNRDMEKKHLVFLTGAGMSVESGFKTFRGSDGLWENYPVSDVATHEGWESNPTLVTNFYNMLRRKLYTAQPNGGHRIIADLERDFRVTVVTQNVDDLHERAGSTEVIHLHGELPVVCSSRNPDDPRYQRRLTAEQPEVAVGEKAGDGSLLRPFIVFFGESVPKFSEAAEAAAKADVFIIVGTSLNVYPAAGLVGYVRHGIPVYLIDPAAVEVRQDGVCHIAKGATEGMEELAALLRGE